MKYKQPVYVTSNIGHLPGGHYYGYKKKRNTKRKTDRNSSLSYTASIHYNITYTTFIF